MSYEMLRWTLTIVSIVATLLVIYTAGNVIDSLLADRELKKQQALKAATDAERLKYHDLHARINELEDDKQNLIDEVRILSRRCIQQANELRYDPTAGTQVMHPSSSGRFSAPPLPRR